MCFLVKKSIDKTKKYFVSNRNLTTEHVKIVINSRLLHFFFSKLLKLQFFRLNFQIPGFLGFQVKWQPCKQHIKKQFDLNFYKITDL